MWGDITKVTRSSPNNYGPQQDYIELRASFKTLVVIIPACTSIHQAPNVD